MNDKKSLKLNDKMKFDNKGGSILGILEGPFCSYKKSTRNRRFYSEEVWDKSKENPIIKELLDNGGIILELEHPLDDADGLSKFPNPKNAVGLIKDWPEKDENGNLCGRVYLTDTPNGRIAYTLSKAGFNFGISSRGDGDTYPDEDGIDVVEASTYDLHCWDLVVIPANEDARLHLITESLDQPYDYKKALTESLNKASDEDKEIMLNTLSRLNIGYNYENSGNIQSKTSTKPMEENNEANNNGSLELVRSLQETLKSKVELDAQILALQNKLAVSDTKVTKLVEEVSRYKNSTIKLSSMASETKELREKVSKLEEELAKKDSTIKSQATRLKKIVESNRERNVNSTSLTESINQKDNEIRVLKENINTQRVKYENKIKTLTENLEDAKGNLRLMESENTKKISSLSTKAKKLVEQYKKITYDTIAHYIDFKASMIGVTPNEIKNRLSESYTIKEIDKVCDDLQAYNINLNKLPFNINSNSKVTKIKVTESKQDVLQESIKHLDDDIDTSLLMLAGLK